MKCYERIHSFCSFRSFRSVPALLSTACLAWLISGCSATQVALSKKDLDVQTKTSTAVFVDPVPKNQRTIYLDVKSGVMEFDRREFKAFVAQQFEFNNDNGYRIVDDPELAQFTMVAYVLNLEKASPTAAQAALGEGFLGGNNTTNAVMAGAAVGAATAGRNNSWQSTATGAVIGGATEFISGALVKDVTYMLVCDIQIKEKTKGDVAVQKDTVINTQVSDAGTSTQSVSESLNHKEYRTRIVTTANKANLDLDEAQQPMFERTAYAMAGFF